MRKLFWIAPIVWFVLCYDYIALRWAYSINIWTKFVSIALVFFLGVMVKYWLIGK